MGNSCCCLPISAARAMFWESSSQASGILKYVLVTCTHKLGTRATSIPGKATSTRPFCSHCINCNLAALYQNSCCSSADVSCLLFGRLHRRWDVVNSILAYHANNLKHAVNMKIARLQTPLVDTAGSVRTHGPMLSMSNTSRCIHDMRFRFELITASLQHKSPVRSR